MSHHLPQPDARVRVHTFHGAHALRLAHLLVGAWTPAGLGSLAAVSAGRLHLVTATVGGEPSGFLLIDATAGDMRITHEAVWAAAGHRDAVYAALVDAGLDACASPWGDLLVGSTSRTLPLLHDLGWRTIAADGLVVRLTGTDVP